MSEPATDPRFLIEVERGEGRCDPFLEGRVFSFSTRCPGKKRRNEDAAAVIPVDSRAGVLVVADGLGGQPGADQASSIAVRALADHLRRDQGGEGVLREALLRGIEEANEQVDALGVGAGTTLAVAVLEGHEIRPYHVGDSTVMVTNRRGRIRLMTVPHSPIGYALEAGLLTEEEALRHPDRHIISNMVGSPEMRIEIGAPLALAAGDTLLLSSDGVTDNLLTEELLEIIHGGSLERSGAALAETCMERMRGTGDDRPGKPDDLTFLLFRCEE